MFEFLIERACVAADCSERWPRGYRFPIYVSYSARVDSFALFYSFFSFPFLWPRGASEGDRRIRGIPWRIIAGDEERSRVDLTIACRACRAIHPLQGVCTRKGRNLL